MHIVTLINPRQDETGQCWLIARPNAPTLLDLSRAEYEAILVSAKRVAEALVGAYRPLGILTFQNNDVFSEQETPHFHMHVALRQQGSDWASPPATRDVRRCQAATRHCTRWLRRCAAPSVR